MGSDGGGDCGDSGANAGTEFVMSFLSRIFRFESRKRDLEAELESHLRMAIADRISRGEKPDEARAAALRELGNVALIEDVTRETWGWLRLERMSQDLGYAFRQMRRSPGFALTVTGTLALGIGAAAAMFTVVDHALLRPVPYRDAGRLVTIREHGARERELRGAPWLDVQEWMAQSHSFSQMGFFNEMAGRNFLEGSSGAVQVAGMAVSPNLFSTIGVSPALGRDFLQEQVSSGAGKNAGTVILGDAAWKEVYGGDAKLLGKSARINDKPYVVVGVMPPGFEMPIGATIPQVWTTIALGSEDRKRWYDSPDYTVIARLRQGVSIRTAAAEVNTIQRRIAPAYPDARVREQRSEALVESYADSLVAADIRKALLALLAAAGVLWLIASVNATNLLLARGAARQREIAMRGALGASRWRILQQFLLEGLLLSGMAAVLGTGLALGAVRLVRSVKPAHLNINFSAHLNTTILAALSGLTLLTALVSSAWPAIVAVRAPIEPALKQGGAQAGSGRRHNRVRSLLVMCEVAMSLSLLAACGLLLRTIYTLRHVPLGYRTDHIIVANLNIPSFRFKGQNIVHSLYLPMLDRVKHLRGVKAAGLTSEVPLGDTFHVTLSLLMNGGAVLAEMKTVTPDVQRVFGFKMLAGRFYDDEDDPNSAAVVVVNPAFARLYAPNKHDPSSLIGMGMWSVRKNAAARIIGVLDNERQKAISQPSQPEVEYCLCQVTPDTKNYGPATTAMDLAVRTDQPIEEMIPEVRDVLRNASPELGSARMTTMDQIVEDSYGSQRLAAHLLEIFGGSALLLSIAGLYGLLAWVVAQRTREMGVRIALGAPRGNLLWLVMREAGGMLLAGAAAGIALAWISSRLVGSYLYGVSAHDGWTLAGAAVLLCACGMIAAYVPARRAAKVDPIVALRAE
jgi:predicted permease